MEQLASCYNEKKSESIRAAEVMEDGKEWREMRTGGRRLSVERMLFGRIDSRAEFSIKVVSNVSAMFLSGAHFYY